ncbi:granulocyte-macrophage colony-stimulating factor receptor subunit alpha-like [Urocitellus parryii]
MSVSSPSVQRPSGAADIHASPPPGSTWVPSTDPFSFKVFLDGKDENEYWPPSSDSRTENTVRLRVKYQRNEIWSEWSRTLRFGTPEEGYGSIPVTLVVLVVGAATLSTVVLMFLCKRYSLWRRLFPPIRG